MFNDIIVRHFSNPTHTGEIAGASRSLELGNAVCGDRIRVDLRLEGDRIAEARYQAWGCATSLATGNAFCEHIEEKSLSEAADTPAATIDALLGELEPSQMHCLEMLRSLFAQLNASPNDR